MLVLYHGIDLCTCCKYGFWVFSDASVAIKCFPTFLINEGFAFWQQCAARVLFLADAV